MKSLAYLLTLLNAICKYLLQAVRYFNKQDLPLLFKEISVYKRVPSVAKRFWTTTKHCIRNRYFLVPLATGTIASKWVNTFRLLCTYMLSCYRPWSQHADLHKMHKLFKVVLPATSGYCMVQSSKLWRLLVTF